MRTSRLWHGLVIFSCGITIPEDEQEVTKELLKPAVCTALLTNDLFSFEKERHDVNCQNSVHVVMREYGCSGEEARERIKQRIRMECAKYVQVVKDTKLRPDISEDVKRYLDVMQYTLSGNVVWSTQCPRYHKDAQWNELQMLRSEHGVAKYPARWPPKDGSDPLPARAAKANGQKRKRNGESAGPEKRANGTNGVKRQAVSQTDTDSLVLANVVSLALNPDLPNLSDDVSNAYFFSLLLLPSPHISLLRIDTPLP